MKHKILGQLLSRSGRNNQGYIIIIAVVIITAVFTVMAISTALSTITHLDKADVSLAGQRARFYVEGCLQEALIQLNRDSFYSGGNLALGSGSCAIVIAGSENSRTVTVTGSLNDYYYEIIAEVSLEPFNLTSVDNF